MVWVDTAGLRVIAARLGDVREGLIPRDAPGSTAGCGFAELEAAARGVRDGLRDTSLFLARQVDGLAISTTAAAVFWESVESALAAVPN